MAKYGDLCESFGERRVTIRKLDTVEEVLKEADVRTCRLCVLWHGLGLQAVPCSMVSFTFGFQQLRGICGSRHPSKLCHYGNTRCSEC